MSKRQSDKTKERSGSRANQKSESSANQKSPQWDLYDDLIHGDNEIEKSKNEISREKLTAEIDNLKEENSKIKERLSNLMVTAQDRINKVGCVLPMVDSLMPHAEFRLHTGGYLKCPKKYVEEIFRT